MKLADFGLAKKTSFLQRRKSNTIVSLWYRAPEIILGSEDYFIGVDMWSMGCIFAELLTLKPLFYCKDEKEALDLAFRILGSPSPMHVPSLLKFKDYEKYRLPFYPVPPSLSSFFPNVGPVALDLLSKMLHLDPRKRITAKEALEHSFFKQ